MLRIRGICHARFAVAGKARLREKKIMPILETNLSALGLATFEFEILKGAVLPFLVPRSFIIHMCEKETKELIQWETEDLSPLSTMDLKLTDMVHVMNSYISAVGGAMSMLLTPSYIISNPALIFISTSGNAKLVYGRDKLSEPHEKIERVARYFASRKHIPGAEPVFSKFANTLRTRKPSLPNCSRLIEGTMREWNGIVGD